MPIPSYEAFMHPLMEAIAGGGEFRLRDLSERIADQCGISAEERLERLASGGQTVVLNRIGWARTYLKKAGLLEAPARGIVRLTNEGVNVMRSRPARIDNRFLSQYPGFVEFLGRPIAEPEGDEAATEKDATPEEAIEHAAGKLRAALADELLERVKRCSPAFFEQLVVELLVAMGYGGSLAEAGKAIGRPGDGGIDGLIKEDMLGLDIICIQAKRWESTVGRPEVQKFAGSMEGHRAKKGVLITTSAFSAEAKDYVTRIERKIVLIDGAQLAGLMIDHNVGVASSRKIEIKKLDNDYFEEQ